MPFSSVIVFSFLPWSYSRRFSFLSTSVFGIFVFAPGSDHHYPRSQGCSQEMFSWEHVAPCFCPPPCPGGQFCYIFSFLCCQTSRHGPASVDQPACLPWGGLPEQDDHLTSTSCVRQGQSQTCSGVAQEPRARRCLFWDSLVKEKGFFLTHFA